MNTAPQELLKKYIQSRWSGRATYRTYLQRFCPAPSAPATLSHLHAAQFPGIASGAARHTLAAARCPRRAGSSWPESEL